MTMLLLVGPLALPLLWQSPNFSPDGAVGVDDPCPKHGAAVHRDALPAEACRSLEPSGLRSRRSDLKLAWVEVR